MDAIKIEIMKVISIINKLFQFVIFWEIISVLPASVDINARNFQGRDWMYFDKEYPVALWKKYTIKIDDENKDIKADSKAP